MAWDPAWFDGAIAQRTIQAWRGVEAQHVVSTMRLVDTPQEQSLLESLLETSKPALPPAAVDKHYLLATPFRYSPAYASRFRPAGAKGQWYGAQSLEGACAELAYWRHRFLLDSAGLREDVLLIEHSFFQARIQGRAIDLMREPWVLARAAWTQDSDYSATHAVAFAAQERGVQWLAYESVRAPGTPCAVVFDPDSLFESLPSLERTLQRWVCKVSNSAVMFSGGGQSFLWEFPEESAEITTR